MCPLSRKLKLPKPRQLFNNPNRRRYSRVITRVHFYIKCGHMDVTLFISRNNTLLMEKHVNVTTRKNAKKCALFSRAEVPTDGRAPSNPTSRKNPIRGGPSRNSTITSWRGVLVYVSVFKFSSSYWNFRLSL